MNDGERKGEEKVERSSAKEIQIENYQKDIHSNCRVKPKLGRVRN